MKLKIMNREEFKELDLAFPLKRLLKEFTSVELMYIHLNTVPGEILNDIFNKSREEIKNYNDFVKIYNQQFKKNFFKKIPRDILIRQISLELSRSGIVDISLFVDYDSDKRYIMKPFLEVLYKDFDMDAFIENPSEYVESLNTNTPMKSMMQVVVNAYKAGGMGVSNYADILEAASEFTLRMYLTFAYEYFDENEILERRLESVENSWLKKVEEKEQKVNKQKEVVKKLNKELSDLKKTIKSDSNVDVKKENEVAVTLASNDNSDFNLVIEKLDEIMKSQKESFEKMVNSRGEVISSFYEKQIMKLNTTISDLKATLIVKNKEIKEQSSEIDALKSELSTLNNLVTSLENSSSKESWGIGEEEGLEEVETVVEEDLINVGYCLIEDEKHYAIDVNGKKTLLNNIKDNTYVANKQFVIYDKNGEFMYSSKSFYDGIYNLSGVKLGIVSSLDPIRIEINGAIDYSIAYHPDIILKKGQIVGIKNSSIVKPFKTIKMNLDHLMEPIKLQNQEVYFIINTFGDKFLLRDIELGDELIMELDTSKVDGVCNKDVVCVKDGVVVNKCSKYWYTNSSFYHDKIQVGVVSKCDDIVFVSKQNGEKSVVGDITIRTLERLNDGDVIAIDEFNDYLYTLDTEGAYIDKVSLSGSKKSATRALSVNDKEAFKPVKIKGKVAVIGSIEARSSYINYFRKNGYDVQFVYGFEKNLSRVIRACKDCEAVICDPSHMGHHIQDNIKDRNYTGFKESVLVGFAEDSGAVSAYEEFQRLKNKA